MTERTFWLRETDVAELVSISDGIEGLERALGDMGRGDAVSVPKALAILPNGAAMHALGSALPQQGVAGFKTWIHTKQGAKAVYALFDSEHGRLLALMEAATLGQIRTAAISGLATRWMAPDDADDMALIGAGRQALGQVAAVHAVRPLRRLRVWSPSADSRARLVAAAREKLDAEIIDAPSLAAATEGAQIVTLVTRAQTPFFGAADSPPLAHLNAVGAILPTHAELKPDAVQAARTVVVDDMAGVRKVGRELIDAYGAADANGAGWSALVGLPELIAGQGQGFSRTGGSIFKSVGMGICDLAIAVTAYERAQRLGMTASIALSEPPALRW